MAIGITIWKDIIKNGHISPGLYQSTRLYLSGICIHNDDVNIKDCQL